MEENRTMKGLTLVFTLTLFFIAAFVQCSDPLTEHIRARRQRRSVNSETEDSGKTEDSYSPVFVGQQEGLKAADQITSLPGQPTGVGSSHYSGYVTVDPTAGRALFYYFAESDNCSSSKPLVLWLNGGPGCSSIGNGAMTELGPFRVNADGKTLAHNPFAWNSAANVLFLESPAGVGFSYSNTTTDYVTGDKKTAADSYTFLVNWLERFPEYKTRDFFITGESYAGHYIPQLAQLILNNNKNTNQTVINLKGIAMGNAFVDYETQNKGRYDYMWTHALISDEIHEGIFSKCNFSSPDPDSNACSDFQFQADEAEGFIDHYNIYAPLCFDEPSDPPKIPIPASEFDPCSSNYVFAYFNTPAVQESLHANTTHLPGKWFKCNGFIHSHWQDEPDSVLPVIKELSESGISVWIYSGDIDSVVPVTTTRYAITKMGFKVKTPWYPWMNQGEVGGYAVGYENLTFVTVRGAGHFVPSNQPARALAMFSSFLEGKLPPSS